MFVTSGSNGTVGRDAWSDNQFHVKPQLIGSTNPVLGNKFRAGAKNGSLRDNFSHNSSLDSAKQKSLFFRQYK